MRPDIWYDRSIRIWVLQWKDSEGNQIGDAEYYPSKKLAKLAVTYERT